MELILIALMFIHGVIHFFGFIKAFRIANISQFTQPITKSQGVFWLLSGAMFVAAAILLSFQHDWWWVVSLTAIVISQYLIISDWHDARFGTLANALILAITVLGFLVWSIMKD